jgi:hypothetical protein
MASFSRKEDSFLRSKEDIFSSLIETILSPAQEAKVTEILIESSGVVKLLLKRHYGVANLCGAFHLCGTEKFCGAEKVCVFTYLELYNLMMAYLIAKGAMENSATDDLTYDEVRKLEVDFHVNWAKTFGPVLTEDLRVVCCEWYRVVYVKKAMLNFSSITFNEDGYEFCKINFNDYRQQLINEICLDTSLTTEARLAAIVKVNNEIFEQPD